jgi:ParB family transcriptional regulator, chromosome partitioning protein
MPIEDKYDRIPLEKIVTGKRQRKSVNVDDILTSIEARGVYNPIIVETLPDGTYKLIAGERRLVASKQLGLKDIPCRFAKDLSKIELRIVEIEENVKRTDLPWQDEAEGICEIHDLYVLLDSEWTQIRTANEIGMTPGYVSRMLRIAKCLDDPQIRGAATWAAASTILSRRDARQADDMLSDIIDAGESAFGNGSEEEPSKGSEPQTKDSDSGGEPKILKAESSILNEDFLEWASNYKGQKFNFIHCDFPYGLDIFKGKFVSRDREVVYDDRPDLYWDLLKCLCENLDGLMAHSAHIMFWYSMEFYFETSEFLRQNAPTLDMQKFPLIWLKSDNAGIMPDAKRGPRRIYETALIGSREDRFIVRPVSNGYPAPIDRRHHTSTKPEPVLRHFFQMFVDESTRLLDPTCGSGSAIRAAESLNAKHVIGLEIDKEVCDEARAALRHFRVLRSASRL